MPHVMEYSAVLSAFDHALNGPFDNPRFLPGSQLPGLSVWRVIDVTSVSTVCFTILYKYYLVKHYFLHLPILDQNTSIVVY